MTSNLNSRLKFVHFRQYFSGGFVFIIACTCTCLEILRDFIIGVVKIIVLLIVTHIIGFFPLLEHLT
jgi:hypothetical protein